jgi:ABC-type amino acid transport substrate-binding protein
MFGKFRTSASPAASGASRPTAGHATTQAPSDPPTTALTPNLGPSASGEGAWWSEMESVAQNFAARGIELVDTQTSAAARIEASSNSLSAISTRANEQASVMSSAANGASESVQTVAAAAGQLKASITEISQQMSHASSMALGITEEAEQTRTVVSALQDAAQSISNVVRIIGGIAEQTNILALNAAIEAARAGSAGKGFAVVAAEVKKLAVETTKATSQIAVQIEEMQGAAVKAARSVETIGTSVERMSYISGSVAAAVEQQSAATSEIARSIDLLSHAAIQLRDSIGTVTKAYAEVSVIADGLRGETSKLLDRSDSLHDEIDSFVARLLKSRDNSAKTKPKTSFVVGVEDMPYLPHYSAEGGTYSGFARDILDKFAADKGYQVTYRPLPLSRLLNEMLHGRIDSKYPDNPQWVADAKAGFDVHYSGPVVASTDGVSVLPKRMGTPVSEVRVLGTVQGFTPWAWLDHIKAGKVKVVETDNFQALVRMTIAGTVDGAFADVDVVRHTLSEMGQPNALQFDPGLPHTVNDYNLSTTRNPELVAEFSQWLNENKAFIGTLKTKHKLSK